MSANKGKPTVADTARREAKLLAKPTKLSIDPFGKTPIELKQPFPKELGEYAVIVIVTPMTTVQFTIAHPIGITDLDEATWVAHRSDQLQGMLARAKDPNQAQLDQSRTATRQQLAVQRGYLCEADHEGKKRFFYPHRSDMDRNQLLEDARLKSKEAIGRVKKQLDSLTDETANNKQALNEDLRRSSDPINFLDDKTASAEVELRKFYQTEEVLREVLEKNPQKYRTLSGPYFTIPQVEIPNSKGLRVEDVAIRFARDIAKGVAGSTQVKRLEQKPTVQDMGNPDPESVPADGTVLPTTEGSPSGKTDSVKPKKEETKSSSKKKDTGFSALFQGKKSEE